MKYEDDELGGMKMLAYVMLLIIGIVAVLGISWIVYAAKAVAEAARL